MTICSMTNWKSLSPKQIVNFLRKYTIDVGVREKKLFERTLRKVRIEPEKGCWLLSEDWSHYTVINKEHGHRFIHKMFNGNDRLLDENDNIVKKFLVCHKCDRPGCINPRHLFKGTAGDNFRDAIGKNRVPFGIKANRQKNEVELNRLRVLDNKKQLHHSLEQYAIIKRMWPEE